jgi:hypothetical protein
MTADLEEELARFSDRLELVIVDEAHHAAAPSYRPLFDVEPLRGLFLTATPNRADNLPIGVDSIAFSTTYRELFESGAVVEPVFDDPVTIEGFSWSSTAMLRDLADYLLNRTEEELAKILVAVTRTENAEHLYEVVQGELDGRDGHPLSAEDVAFVHGARSSAGVPPTDFLDEFTARPRGILVATSQLVGEGFDDPGIDGVVITYPSTSIGHLMQVAGRALRWAPGKRTAHIVQVHGSWLEYHFEQRWLYQDISDSLRPQLTDLPYSTVSGLREDVTRILREHNVDMEVGRRVLRGLEGLAAGENFSLLLTGIPFYEDPGDFAALARWGAIGVAPGDRAVFLQIFNEFADRGTEVNDNRDYLANYLTPDPTHGSEWKSYMDMLAAMEYARKEIDREPYHGASSRVYLANVGTSWLKYVTFQYSPAIPVALEEFLRDAVNRDEISSLYLSAPGSWVLAVKIPLPLAGTLGFLLDAKQVDWLQAQRATLVTRLANAPAELAYGELHRWRLELTSVPLPLVLIERIEYLLTEQRLSDFSLDL